MNDIDDYDDDDGDTAATGFNVDINCDKMMATVYLDRYFS
jgi:hypothetical protein